MIPCRYAHTEFHVKAPGQTGAFTLLIRRELSFFEINYLSVKPSKPIPV